jgi:hypothetical protein
MTGEMLRKHRLLRSLAMTKKNRIFKKDSSDW